MANAGPSGVGNGLRCRGGMPFAKSSMPEEQLVQAQSPVASVASVSAAPLRDKLEYISNLSNDHIQYSLNPQELIAIIRSVDYPFAGKERLEYFDRDTLERVVCLVRRWSCHQLGKPSL
jgi:hypothetical protein